MAAETRASSVHSAGYPRFLAGWSAVMTFLSIRTDWSAVMCLVSFYLSSLFMLQNTALLWTALHCTVIPWKVLYSTRLHSTTQYFHISCSDISSFLASQPAREITLLAPGHTLAFGNCPMIHKVSLKLLCIMNINTKKKSLKYPYQCSEKNKILNFSVHKSVGNWCSP